MIGESKLVDLENKFSDERKKISETIQTKVIEQLNDVKNIADVQVVAASQRQLLVDRSSEIRSLIRRKKHNYHSTRKNKFAFYKTEYKIKLSDYEIARHIESDIEETSNLVSVLENQLTYYKDTVDTLDKIGFKIKYLIETTKYLNGLY